MQAHAASIMLIFFFAENDIWNEKNRDLGPMPEVPICYEVLPDAAFRSSSSFSDCAIAAAKPAAFADSAGPVLIAIHLFAAMAQSTVENAAWGFSTAFAAHDATGQRVRLFTSACAHIDKSVQRSR